MAYQNWWPASCTVTSTGSVSASGASHDVPAVMSVGYSMPSASLCQAGSTIVSCP